ncbi:MAG TPA: B-box zinc finger protein [Verrucomicrobiae bacterium]|nr:B-box zinc finger protein [Verrucomicrobiae bacterium]
MNCQVHPEVPASAYCRSCGKPVCDQCRRDAFGTVYCADHVPGTAPAADAPPPGDTAGAPNAPPPPYYPPSGTTEVSPPLAFFLGVIPGVGAIYNGQYAKGLVHAFIWGILMSIANSRAANGVEAVFVGAIIAWWFYMALEAYHTARKRRLGETVDEYSSLIDFSGNKTNVSVAGVALILVGILLLLHTLDLLDFERIARFWPVVLIAAGAYLLWGRLMGEGEAPREARNGRH